MRGCQHRAAHDEITRYLGDENLVRKMVRKECRRCGAWLPLGQSNDDDEAVHAEMLAAYLASFPGFASVAHKDNHDIEDCDENYCFSFREDCVGCQGEYLARVISTTK